MAANNLQLNALELGGGQVSQSEIDTLTLPPIASGYANAQLDDYHHLPRQAFAWQPPLVMKLQARANHDQPLGTLGFGFWNDPFTISMGQAGAARWLPAAPNALWFFYCSPPNELALTPGGKPVGWKASSLKSPRLPVPLLAPPALFALLLTLIPKLRPLVIRSAKKCITASERNLAQSISQWHHYQLEWRQQKARFWVDDQIVLEADRPPRGPLGFVLWIDNQFAQVSTVNGLRFGVLSTNQTQKLEVRDLSIQKIP